MVAWQDRVIGMQTCFSWYVLASFTNFLVLKTFSGVLRLFYNFTKVKEEGMQDASFDTFSPIAHRIRFHP